VSYYQPRRRGTYIIDERFVGRSMEAYTVDGTKLLGLVDEVSVNEIGMLVENSAVIVPRTAIAYIITGQSDVHGYGECCEKEFVLDEDFVGSDVEVKIINGAEVAGRLVKVSKHEIVIAHENRAYVIPRNSIIYVKILKRL